MGACVQMRPTSATLVSHSHGHRSKPGRTNMLDNSSFRECATYAINPRREEQQSVQHG